MVSFAGSFLVAIYALWDGAGVLHIGDLALIGAVITASIGYAVGAKLSKAIGGWQVICWAIILGFPLAIIPTFYYAPESLSNISLSTFLSFSYLILVSQLFAFFVWYKGLALGGVARVSQVQLLQVFVTIIASIILVHESINPTTIIFSILVVGTVWLGKNMKINDLNSTI